VTVVDTPGFNEDLEAEEETIDQIVNFLRNDLQYVHAFILTFKVGRKLLERMPSA
jgi:hypothetical protein